MKLPLREERGIDVNLQVDHSIMSSRLYHQQDRPCSATSAMLLLSPEIETGMTIYKSVPALYNQLQFSPILNSATKTHNFNWDKITHICLT